MNQSTQQDILDHLTACDSSFKPRLSQTVNLEDYSEKLFKSAQRIEIWDDHSLSGLLACYSNFDEDCGYITNLSVLESHTGKGLGQRMLDRCCELILEKGLSRLKLEVNKANKRARLFYGKNQFFEHHDQGTSLILIKDL